MHHFYQTVANRLDKGQSCIVQTNLNTGEKTLCESGEEGVFGNIYREIFYPRPTLVLCGGGHVSAMLCPLAAQLDFDVTVMDDRAEFANRTRFPTAKTVCCAPFDEALANVAYTDSSYFAIVTRGHLQDKLCLTYVLNRPYAYVGMIGSRRKNAMLRDELLQEGYTAEQFARVYAPIGEDIGAESVAEIAVSIAAQLVRVRHTLSRGVPAQREVLAALCGGKTRVLATVIQKKGSAPRGTSARLVLLQDNQIVGTVGGGFAESQVIEEAKKLTNGELPKRLHFAMTNADAGSAGMICGGEIEVLLERVDTLGCLSSR